MSKRYKITGGPEHSVGPFPGGHVVSHEELVKRNADFDHLRKNKAIEETDEPLSKPIEETPSVTLPQATDPAKEFSNGEETEVILNSSSPEGGQTGTKQITSGSVAVPPPAVVVPPPAPTPTPTPPKRNGRAPATPKVAPPTPTEPVPVPVDAPSDNDPPVTVEDGGTGEVAPEIEVDGSND